VVPFLKKRSDNLAKKVANLRQISNPIKGSPYKGKNPRSREIILIFEQERYKRFLIKYQKFVLLTLGVDIGLQLNDVVRLYEELAISKGPVKAVKMFKQLYDLSLRVVTSNKFDPIPFLKSDRAGIPRILGNLVPLMKGTYNERRACLAALSLIKVVGVEDKVFSTSTISQNSPIPQIGFDELPEVNNYFKRYIKSSLGNSCKIDLDRFSRCYQRALEIAFPEKDQQKRLDMISKFSALHLSGRNGPNGPALTTAVLDHSSLCPLKGKPVKFYSHIKSISQMTGNKGLNILIDNFEEEPYTWSNSKGKNPINSRISLKRERWAKTRPFAICDYFSQSALKGFHRYLFRWLREQPEDGTFKQDEVSESVRKWTESIPDDDQRVESADLSAATDSIPLEIQAEIVCQIAGKKFAHDWMNVVADRWFKLPNDSFIRYNTGQPMGLLSSWGMLAVWHHIMVRSCLLYCRIKRHQQPPVYHVIGDDVSMKGTNLFFVYEEVVGTVQGVGISKVKGYHKITQTMENPIPFEDGVTFMHTAELAKRVYVNGREVTIVPPDEVFTSLENAAQFPELLYSLKNRGYPQVEITTLPSLTALCSQRRLALLLSTSPLLECAPYNSMGVTPSEMPKVFENLPWFSPGFNKDLFIEKYAETLKQSLITTLARTVSNLSEWRDYSLRGGEIKVKGWDYVCETQGVLIFFIGQDCLNSLTRIMGGQKLKEIFPGKGIVNYRLLKGYIGELQVIFEIDYLLKEGTISRELSRKDFSNYIITDILKKMSSAPAVQA
jgi:hypothetical protein